MLKEKPFSQACGNPGRPRGSKNRTTRLLEELVQLMVRHAGRNRAFLAPGADSTTSDQYRPDESWDGRFPCGYAGRQNEPNLAFVFNASRVRTQCFIETTAFTGTCELWWRGPFCVLVVTREVLLRH